MRPWPCHTAQPINPDFLKACPISKKKKSQEKNKAYGKPLPRRPRFQNKEEIIQNIPSGIDNNLLNRYTKQ